MNLDNEETKQQFKKIYDETYHNVLRFIVIKTHDINEVNDIIQETYLELWKILNKKVLLEDNLNSFMLGIANNKIKKHFTFLKKLKTLTVDNYDKDIENIKEERITLEDLNVQKEEWNFIWQYLKSCKNQDIPKIFYLYYEEDLTLKEIAAVLKKNESYVKSLLYRTLIVLRKGGYRE